MPMNKIPRTITVTQLTSFMCQCQRRLWLDLHGNEADKVMLHPDQERWMQQGNQHEQQIVTTCYGPVHSVSVRDWPDLVRQTREWMSKGIALICQGGLEVPLPSSRLLIGRPDVLVRVNTPSTIGAWHYRPIEIKSYRDKKKAKAAEFQLQCYRWMLNHLQGVEPVGELWLGADSVVDSSQLTSVRPHTIEQLRDPLGKDIEQAVCDYRKMEQQVDAPPIFFDRDWCSYCEWRFFCERVAFEKNDLVLVPELKKRTIEELRQDGIETLETFVVLTPAQLGTYPYVGKQGGKYIAHAQAILTGRGIPLSRNPQLPAPSPALYLDLETSADERIWAFGFAQGAEATQVVLVVPPDVPMPSQSVLMEEITITFVRDIATGWQCVAHAIMGRDGPIVHWSNHEPRFLEKTAPPALRPQLTSRLFDLHKWSEQNYALPSPRRITQKGGYSVKALSPWLGVDRPAEDTFQAAEDSFTAWCRFRREHRQHREGHVSQDRTPTFLKWLRNVLLRNPPECHSPQDKYPTSQDRSLLRPVVLYVRADVQFLVKMWDWYRSEAARQEVGSRIREG